MLRKIIIFERRMRKRQSLALFGHDDKNLLQDLYRICLCILHITYARIPTCRSYETFAFCMYTLMAIEIPTGTPCKMYNNTNKATFSRSPLMLGPAVLHSLLCNLFSSASST